MIDYQTVSMLDLLPPNLRSDPVLAAAAAAIDAEAQATAAEIRELDIYGRTEEWISEETDELAWQYRPPYYDSALPLEQRRELVKNAIPFHRTKGTPAAVEQLIALLFGEGDVEEWWQYGGDPYHFRVITNNADVTTSRAREFIQAVEAVKRLSTTMDSVTIAQTEPLDLYFAGFIHSGETISF